MKAYTDIKQSKMLAEILPLESADMSWVGNGLGKPFARTIPIKGNPEELCACWSLAALLDVLPTIHKQKPLLDLEECSIMYSGTDIYIEASNPVDACYEMIVELNKRNLI
jgi:hypothetical protein